MTEGTCGECGGFKNEGEPCRYCGAAYRPMRMWAVLHSQQPVGCWMHGPRRPG